MMVIPRVETFLRYFSLKTGVITAIALSILTAIMELLLGLAILRNPESAGFDGRSRFIGVLFIFLSAWNVFLAYMLFRALKTGEPHHMRPWLVYTLLTLIIAAVEIIANIFRGHFRIIFRIIELAFYIYLWVVVYSYSKQLEEGRTGQATRERSTSSQDRRSS